MKKEDTISDGKIIFEGVRDFDCDHIFDCGQCFRWEKQQDGSYTGLAAGAAANVAFEPYGSGDEPGCSEGRVIVSAVTGGSGAAPGFWSSGSWRNYLDLDRDYGAIKAVLSADDPVMEQAIAAGSGIRILNQDLWETIVSFIISQNNNIPRIKGCIERLAGYFGEPIEGAGIAFQGMSEAPGNAPVPYTLPAPEKLASLTVDDLAPVRLGYRAKYLIETARCVTEKGLPRNMEELSSLCGVGPKVANCIALFGMGARSSFPIDVWVRRVMAKCYGFDEQDMKGMAEFAHARFGEMGGYAQQYLFFWRRGIEKGGADNAD